MSIERSEGSPQARETIAVNGYYEALHGLAMENMEKLEGAARKLGQAYVMEHDLIIGGLTNIRNSIEQSELVDCEEIDLTYSCLVRSFVFSGLYGDAPQGKNVILSASMVLGKDSKWMREQLDMPAESIEVLGFAPEGLGKISEKRGRKALKDLAPRRGNYKRRFKKFGREVLFGWTNAQPEIVAARLMNRKKSQS